MESEGKSHTVHVSPRGLHTSLTPTCALAAGKATRAEGNTEVEAAKVCLRPTCSLAKM